MMHLLAYRLASSALANNQDIPGLTDTFATLQNNHFILQSPWYIRWAMALGLHLTNARINTPALRAVALPSVQPNEIAANPGNLPAISDFPAGMIQLKPIDETAFEASDDTGSVAITGLLGLLDQVNYNIPSGPVSVLRATSSITAGNGVWGLGSFTLDQTLPAGRYAVIGLDVVGANLIAARLVFPTAGPRPGVPARTSFSNHSWPLFLNGNLGNWGEFESTAIPSIEILGSAAPTTQTIFIKVVKVR